MKLFYTCLIIASVEGWKDIFRVFSKGDYQRMGFKRSVQKLRKQYAKKNIDPPIEGKFHKCLNETLNDTKFKLKKGRKFKTVMTDRYFDGKDPNGYWLCQEDTCMKYCKRPYTMLGDENGSVMSTNICQKDKKSDTLRWSRDVKAFPMCQKCDTASFHSDTVDRNLGIECVSDKSVRYRQSCQVQCKSGYSLFVAGTYKEYQGLPTEIRCKCEDEFCEQIGWKVFNPNRKNEMENGVFMSLNDPFITKEDLACL